MIFHDQISDDKLHSQLKTNVIKFAGNQPNKIYGRLHCKSGKRMKRHNRIFFATEQEAVSLGYRPCGNCMKTAYRLWNSCTKL